MDAEVKVLTDTNKYKKINRWIDWLTALYNVERIQTTKDRNPGLINGVITGEIASDCIKFALIQMKMF